MVVVVVVVVVGGCRRLCVVGLFSQSRSVAVFLWSCAESRIVPIQSSKTMRTSDGPGRPEPNEIGGDTQKEQVWRW